MNVTRIQFIRDLSWQNPIVWRTNLLQEHNSGSFEQQHPTETHRSSVGDSSDYQIGAFKISMYYLEHKRFLKRFFLNAGYRVSLFTLSRELSVDPRLRLSY